MRSYLCVNICTGVYQERAKDLRFEAKPMLLNTGYTPAHNVTYKAKADILPFPLPKDFNLPSLDDRRARRDPASLRAAAHADGNSIRARFASRTVLDPWTSKAALIQPRLLTPAASLRRETNRQACFISPSAERPIVRRFDTRGKTRAGFRGGKARCPDWYITSHASRMC